MMCVSLATLAAACAPEASEHSTTDFFSSAPTDVVDSIRPIEVELRRFRETLGDPATELAGGTTSREALVESFLNVLASDDRLGIESLAVTPEEFAYLYYPNTRYIAPPYEMSPALLWFELERQSIRGLERAAARIADIDPGATGHRCPEPPLPIGTGRLWEKCLVEITGHGEAPVVVPILGPIFEWEGNFKFLGFANDGWGAAKPTPGEMLE